MRENNGLTTGQQYLAFFGFIGASLALAGAIYFVEESELIKTEIAPKLAAMLREAQSTQ